VHVHDASGSYPDTTQPVDATESDPAPTDPRYWRMFLALTRL
jgi:hypothetical protein